jgi:hypothetical protein
MLGRHAEAGLAASTAWNAHWLRLDMHESPATPGDGARIVTESSDECKHRLCCLPLCALGVMRGEPCLVLRHDAGERLGVDWYVIVGLHRSLLPHEARLVTCRRQELDCFGLPQHAKQLAFEVRPALAGIFPSD